MAALKKEGETVRMISFRTDEVREFDLVSDLHQGDGDDHRNEGLEGGPDEALHGVLHGRRRDQNRVGTPGS